MGCDHMIKIALVMQIINDMECTYYVFQSTGTYRLTQFLEKDNPTLFECM